MDSAEVAINVAERSIGSFFGRGFHSVECPRCKRPGLLIQKHPREVAHAFTLKTTDLGDVICEWQDVCGSR